MPTAAKPKWIFPTVATQFINWTAISNDAERMVAGTFEFNKWDTHTTYCFDRSGKVLWKDDLVNSFDGVFWVAISADGNYAASGGYRGVYNSAAPKKSVINGFIRAYDAETGKVLLDETTASRVGSLEFSADGGWLVAGSGDKAYRESLVYLFRRENNGYVKADTFAATGGDVGSVSISGDGKWVVAGMSGSTHREENISSTTEQAGNIAEVRLFENQHGKLIEKARWQDEKDLQIYIQMVRITPDAKWIAASGPRGMVYLFNRTAFIKSKQPNWTYRCASPKNVYGVSISNDGQFIAAPNNISENEGGLIYLLKNVKSGKGYKPSVVWTGKTSRSPNPGVTMDAKAKFVTAADGYPVAKPTKPSPGHLSLFSREQLSAVKKTKSKKKPKSGTKSAPRVQPLWTLETPDMCWPMSISADGAGIIAGDDDGNVYFFETSDVTRTL
ncbi:MAG: hypothetical protein IAF08_04120 [Rhizobacter sp.]|nr:hypothetical protein [Chlorobiales bacterium]